MDAQKTMRERAEAFVNDLNAARSFLFYALVNGRELFDASAAGLAQARTAKGDAGDDFPTVIVDYHRDAHRYASSALDDLMEVDKWARRVQDILKSALEVMDMADDALAAVPDWVAAANKPGL